MKPNLELEDSVSPRVRSIMRGRSIELLDSERIFDLRDVEAMASEISELKAENERLRKELERLMFRLAEVEDIPATCPICGQSGNHVHSGELP